MQQLIKKLIMILLLLLIAGGGAYLVYTFFKDDLWLLYNSNRIDSVSRNVALHIYTNMTTRKETDYLYEITEGSIEQITEEELALFYNEGEVQYSMEARSSTLKINSALIDGAIFDGTDAHTLSKGFWHFPLSKAAGMRGNTVIIGHRYDKMPPATDTFFNLDKVKLGDKIIIEQDSQEWVYTVAESKVVQPDDRSVLAQTNDFRLTLITCHPLWSSKERLVIVAKLDRGGVI